MLSLSIKRKVAKEICTFLRTFNTLFLASQVAQRLKHLPAMQETWVRSLGQEDPLEKEMATHSSVLAWRIPGMGQPGGLPSMGSHRVGHDWSDLAAAIIELYIMNWLILWYKRASQIAVVIKNQPANAGDIRDMGSIPGSGRSPGEGKGYPPQYSGLENSMDCIDHEVAKSQDWATEWLSLHWIT